MYITKWKKPIYKGYMLYDFHFMVFWRMLR